jgi:hypothetical protein
MKKKIILNNGCEIRIIGVIKGLTNEREKVRTEFTIKPESVAMSISPEELKGLEKYQKNGAEEQIILTDYEEMYAEKLSAFGDIEIPPPCYVEALVLSKKEQIHTEAIDMDESKFTDVYCAYVTGSNLLVHSLRKGFLRNKKYKAKTAEEFVIEWDRKVNKLSGFKKLEESRERYMAKRLLKISDNYKNILAFIELERANGVATKIKDIEQVK